MKAEVKLSRETQIMGERQRGKKGEGKKMGKMYVQHEIYTILKCIFRKRKQRTQGWVGFVWGFPNVDISQWFRALVLLT